MVGNNHRTYERDKSVKKIASKPTALTYNESTKITIQNIAIQKYSGILMKNKLWKSSLCLVLSFFGSSCKSQTDSITYGCSGGFTGGGSGVKIISDGSVIKWTSTIDEISEQQLRRDQELTDEAFSRLEELNIHALDYQQLGNFTCTLSVKKGNHQYSISWTNNNDKKIEKVLGFSNWLQKKVEEN